MRTEDEIKNMIDKLESAITETAYIIEDKSRKGEITLHDNYHRELEGYKDKRVALMWVLQK